MHTCRCSTKPGALASGKTRPHFPCKHRRYGAARYLPPAPTAGWPRWACSCSSRSSVRTASIGCLAGPPHRSANPWLGSPPTGEPLHDGQSRATTASAVVIGVIAEVPISSEAALSPVRLTDWSRVSATPFDLLWHNSIARPRFSGRASSIVVGNADAK